MLELKWLKRDKIREKLETFNRTMLELKYR